MSDFEWGFCAGPEWLYSIKMILAELKKELAQYPQRRSLDVSRRRFGSTIEFRGKTLVDFGHFDYLCLSTSPVLRRSFHEFLESEGLVPATARFQGGSTPPLSAAEVEMARFLGTERALLFPSRTQAILSTLTGLANERDIFFMDEALQAPYSDAAYLVGAEVQTFTTFDGLQKQLERTKGARRRFVIAEALSPLTGELTDLPLVSGLATRFDANLILDESYSLGVVGARGAGCGERMAGSVNEPLAAGMLCSVADLSFGMAASGAVVAGSSILIETIVQRSKALAGDPPLPSYSAALLIKSLELVELAPLQRERVLDLAGSLRATLPRAFLVGSTARNLSPIVCLQFSKVRDANEFVAALFQRGLFAQAVHRNATLSEAGIVRLVINASHSERQVEEAQRLVAELLARFSSATK